MPRVLVGSGAGGTAPRLCRPPTCTPAACPCGAQPGAVGSEYGKYGIIRETDMYAKRPEFQLWAIEARLGVVAQGGAHGGRAWRAVVCSSSGVGWARRCRVPPRSSGGAPPDCSPRGHPAARVPLCAQVKKVDIEAMPRAEEKEMFRDFMEEYNTASLPSK